MSKRGFLHGTFILVGAGFITKIMGFIYKIALSRIVGDEGIGLFQMAFPLLLFLNVITTAGLPVAISKLVSEAITRREAHRIRLILIISIFIVCVTSLVITGLLLLCASFIARTLLTDQRAVYSLLAMAPIIPVIAISSIFRGYFQGKQQMKPYATSTIIEQVVRIFTVILIARYLLPYGIEYASAGAMLGMVLGELAGFLFLIYSFKRDPQKPDLSLFAKRSPHSFAHASQKKLDSLKEVKRTVSELLHLAIPITAGRLIGSLSYAIEPIVVAQSLALAGIASAISTALYGQLEGMAIPIVFFPAFITYALSVSLVPAISESIARKNYAMVEHRLQQTIRLSIIIGAPCVVLIFILAEPLSILLYRRSEVGHLMQLMAPFAILFYLQGPLTSILQGLDLAQIAMRNSIIGAIIKTGLIFILGSHANWGIDGVVLAINCGLVVVTSLHFISIIKVVPLTVRGKETLKMLTAIGLMSSITYYFSTHSHSSLLLHTLTTTCVCLGSYLISLLIFSLIKKEDVNRIPWVGKWLAFFLPR